MKNDLHVSHRQFDFSDITAAVTLSMFDIVANGNLFRKMKRDDFLKNYYITIIDRL